MEKADRKTRLRTNFHELELPKAVQDVETHSFWELLFLGIKLLDPNVVQLETRPEHIRGANGKSFVPDVRYRTSDGTDHYALLCSAMEFQKQRSLLEPLFSAFAVQRSARYEFVSYEEVEAQQHFGWLGVKIGRLVQQYKDVDLDRVRALVRRAIAELGETTLGRLALLQETCPAEWVIAAACSMLLDGQLQIVDRDAKLDKSMKVRIGPKFVESERGTRHG